MAKRSKRARSLAALKGWKTRRAGARKRSKAAKKGWKTRRANKKKSGLSEYQVNIKYVPGDKVKAEIQISAIGPSGLSRGAVLEMIRARERDDENPEGWKIKITEWKKAGQAVTKGEAANSEAAWSIVKYPFSKTFRGNS